jgi:hypothetical protein
LPSRSAVVFNESGTLQVLEPSVATVGDTLRLWYTDEHALLLGIKAVSVKVSKNSTTTTNYPVTPFVATDPAVGTKVAGSATDPATGATEAQGGTDFSGRPIPPSLFCTDITLDINNISGDWQQGGTAIGPDFVSGSWKGAVVLIDQTKIPNTKTITTDSDPAKNGFTLGPGADPKPAGLTNLGYTAEARWNVNLTDSFGPNCGQLQSGHTYRMQFMVHDGDQNKSGGDVGQACAIVTIP